MKKKQLIVGLVVLALLAVFFAWAVHKVHFDFHVFAAQLRLADWSKIAIGLGCIYLGFVFRSARWALLLRHNKKVHPFSLVGTQVMGFTAVALIGRVADLVRPYLVTRYWLAFVDLFRDPIQWRDITRGLALQGVYVGVLLAAAWANFTTKDVTS